ncbi:bone morphogenetic protein receptor type-1B [Galendromus occidentalis]|uniref:Serine/threonine-protein kinase receptor n=1 Tax=Galendromus occidentalis TaxID=34638 RepID=A0AAJ6QME4_9ACAR|nr:bone morphogenetic protein receptor type-1B [Galendromus occidentalis]
MDYFGSGRVKLALIFLTLTANFQAPEAYRLECYCDGHCPEGTKNGSCTIYTQGGMCWTHVEEVLNEATHKVELEYTYGCSEEDKALLTCKSHLLEHKVPQNIECCRNEPYCNKPLKPKMASPQDVEEAVYRDYTSLVVFIAALLMCSALSLGLSLLYYRRRRKRLETSEDESFLPTGVKSLQELMDCSITSGSGSGFPKMVQRTVARQVELKCPIGKGRYGEVYKATLNCDYVACKVFYTTEEASWSRETEIYQTNLLRHDHILGFIAADIRGTGGWTQLLLITTYQENGSLYDYLTNNTLDEDQAVEMALSASSGICHLHTEILGKQAKPAIAHRDIKSKNILVKRDGTCCIADFGLAVRFNKTTNQIDIGPHNTRVGTVRYMAPEVLDETLKTENFNSYCQADMYSFGLVLWEITSRIVRDGVADPYRIPYHDAVGNDPSFDQMKKVVCISQIRPEIPKEWEKHETTMSLVRIFRELWSHNPSSRLTALRVKKSLTKLENDVVAKRYNQTENV